MGGWNLYAFCGNNAVNRWDALGVAGDVTHGIKKCYENDECEVLVAKIIQWMKNHEERYQELRIDKYDFQGKRNPANYNPEKWNNHINELESAAKHVHKCICYLHKKIAKNECCPPYNDYNRVPKFYPRESPSRLVQKDTILEEIGGRFPLLIAAYFRNHP
jgi:hypothetical protein